MIMFYCGADYPWEELQKIGFNRRNTCLLQAFTQSDKIERVIVVNYVLRTRLFRAMLRRVLDRGSKDNHVTDIFVTSLLPERWRWLPLRILNRWMARLQIWMQAGSLPKNHLVTWCYWPEGYRVARRLQLPGILAFDADHNILHDENQSAGDRAELEQLLKEIAHRADLIVAGARSILSWFSERAACNPFRLRNATDPARFSASRARATPSGEPVIGYVGTLSPWVDHQLLLELAQKRPGWRFQIIGETYKEPELEQLFQLPNMHFIGKRSAEQLSVELEQFDVALGLYRKEEWLDVDSMKFFDYLAAGIPVVSTPFHPRISEDFNGLIELALNADAFVDAIESILCRDDAAKQDWDCRRRDFIQTQTWNTRAAEALDDLRAIAGGHV